MSEGIFFTPARELYYSERDGLWEFGESGLGSRELPSLPVRVVSDRREVVLNSLESPRYLVENKTTLDFTLEEEQELWLEFEYGVESRETDRGFDDPALVIFLGEELVWKKPVKDICCGWSKQVVYLDKRAVGDYRLHFYAGETGDLEKPTQIKIKNIEVLVDVKVQEAFVLNKSEDVNEPALLRIVSQTQEKVGEVLGSVMPERQEFKKIVFNPWAFLVTWIVMLVLVTIFWELVSKNSFMKGGDYEKKLKKK